MVNHAIDDESEYYKKKFGNFVSTRHLKPPEWLEKEPPRLGRRESEPHSVCLMRIYDILTTNFPNDRVLIDLHHYFYITGEKVDLQFDLSYFKGMKLDYMLLSYNSSEFNNRVPTMAINILSKSTYLKDLSHTVDLCKKLRIPVYVIFSSHDISVSVYKPPFLRVYILEKSGLYKEITVNGELFDENGEIIENNIIKTSPIVPFNISIMKLPALLKGGTPTYSILFLDPATNKLYKKESEKEKERAEKEKERAEKEKERADMLERILEKYKKNMKSDS
ncbi:MAG: hypothetical protein ACTSPY_15305 [Candidatus Helarchaeota archaeon]